VNFIFKKLHHLVMENSNRPKSFLEAAKGRSSSSSHSKGNNSNPYRNNYNPYKASPIENKEIKNNNLERQSDAALSKQTSLDRLYSQIPRQGRILISEISSKTFNANIWSKWFEYFLQHRDQEAVRIMRIIVQEHTFHCCKSQKYPSADGSEVKLADDPDFIARNVMNTMFYDNHWQFKSPNNFPSKEEADFVNKTEQGKSICTHRNRSCQWRLFGSCHQTENERLQSCCFEYGLT